MDGGRLNPPSQRRISPLSAWADIELSRSIRAATGTSRPFILTSVAPSMSAARASLPPGTRRTAPVFFGSGKPCRKVIQHASSGGHAARGDDDGRLARRHQVLRLLRRRNDRQALGGEHADAPRGIGMNVGIELFRAVGVELQRLLGHRAVHVHRHDRHPLRRLELPEPIEHLLDAADGERGNDELPAPLNRVVDDRREPSRPSSSVVELVAVRRLDQQDVGLLDRRRIRQHGPAVAAEVAAEQDRLAGHPRPARTPSPAGARR